MQNGRLFPRAGARCAVATALAASLGIVLAGAVSGCSFDLLKPGAFDIFKQAAASSTVTAPSASALPGAANPSRAANSAATPVAEAQTDEPPPPPAPVAPDEPPEPSTPALDRVVASVDGDPITMREVKDFAAQHGQPIQTDDFASSDTAKTAVKALIGEKLLEQEVKKYDDKVDDAQVDRYIQQLRQDKHMSDAEFRAQLQASGISYDELRKRARLDIEKGMMIEQEVRSKIDVPEADIKAYYDAHKEDFTITKERLKLAQILIALPPNPTAAQVSAAQKKADMIRARAAKGDDFGDLARVYSDDESKSNGGELGWFAPSDVMDQILAAVKPLKPGEISAPVRTSHGIHIVKLEEHEVPGVQPLNDVKAPIRAQLVDQQSGAQLQKWVESDLVKQHYVETMY
ncbi:peptidylprolyl isomerase [Candidatus Binatus sp.]|jgi:peptidyl-prolyl cis-trans isomerase SurA|uniref:peptidylprolyl isomerase n=1 Tax=Candidatus Binatus sp. TaxID=2811406 RepID=UPI003C48F108